MKIIDSAVRLTAGDDGKLDVRAWLEHADRWSIDHAVVAPAEPHVAVLNREGNEQVAALAAGRPERLSGLAVANPWWGTDAVALLEKAFDSGLRGLYLDPGRQGFRLSEPIVWPLLEFCEKQGKPVYCHTGTPIFSMPFQLAEVARRFPGITFIMGHGAYTDFWYDVTAAARQADNIVVDSSCVVGGLLGSILEGLGSDRVLFGSGYPASLPENELEKIDLLELEPADKEALFCKTAHRVWGVNV